MTGKITQNIGCVDIFGVVESTKSGLNKIEKHCYKTKSKKFMEDLIVK